MATNTNPFYTYSATAGSSKTLQKPQDGGDNNQWGNYINTDLDEIVAAVNALSDKIADASENTLVDFTATGSAVNHVGITNAATGNPPQISSAGSDTNVDLTLTAKGTGDINLTPGTNGDVNIPASKGITFGDDGEKIEGDGTDLTIASSATLNVNTGSSSGNDLKVNTSQLVVEGDTGNVGINTTAPNGKLTSATSKDSTALAIVNTTTTTLGTEKNYISFYGTNNSGNLITTPLAEIGAQSNNGSYQQGDLLFKTSPFNSSSTERMRISSTGNVTVSTGNLVIGSAGQGIDFSASSATDGIPNGGEVLEHVERGTFTPFVANSDGTNKSTVSETVYGDGRYSKIGNVCHVWFNIRVGINSVTDRFYVSLPITSDNNQSTTTGTEGFAYPMANTANNVHTGSVASANTVCSFESGSGTALTCANMSDSYLYVYACYQTAD